MTAPAFLLVEHRRAHPMLPLGLFRARQFSGANAVTFAVYGALGGALFLLPVELQIVAHYSPLASGLALLPVTLVMLVFSARSGQLSSRIGPRLLQMTLGPFVVGAGLILLTRATNPGSYLTQVFPAVMLFGIGLAIVVAPLTATTMGAAPAEHAGIASAVNNVVARRGRAARRRRVAVALGPFRRQRPLGATALATGFRTAMLHLGLRGGHGRRHRRIHDPQGRTNRNCLQLSANTVPGDRAAVRRLELIQTSSDTRMVDTPATSRHRRT